MMGADGLITFFDVETPNGHNDRICSIGIVQADMFGALVNRVHTLIDPESPFSDVNMRIHGIAPVDVRGKPTFPEVWNDTLAQLLDGPLVAAHNADFDLCVLEKTLRAYGIAETSPDYACTLRMSRSILPGLDNYKLPTVCRVLGVDLGRHHDAASDAEACMGVFWRLADGRGDARSLFSPYLYDEPMWTPGMYRRELCEKTASVGRLVQLLSTVMDDGRVSVREALDVLSLISCTECLASDPMVAPMVPILQDAVSDGELDDIESATLADLFGHLVDPSSGDPCGKIEFDGSEFCLTGNFDHGPKESVAEYIESRGGTVAKAVRKACRYVVVGGQGSEAFAMGNYGTKVKKALDWQAKGVPISVIREDELFEE